MPHKLMNHSAFQQKSSTAEVLGSENVYFAALITANGFQSKFEEIFSKANRTVILKGGPGTGKSTLMRAVAAEAENRGLGVEYFLCSSDSRSLDAVLIGNGSLAVIDGTSPHCVDPKIPGVREEIINLGEFWNSSLLRSRRVEIEKYLLDIKLAYEDVYEAMKIAHHSERLAESLVLRHTDKEKLDSAVDRIVKRFKGDSVETRYRGLSAFGTRGRIFLDSYELRAGEVYSLHDRYRLSHVFLDTLKEKLTSKKVGFDYSLSPVYCRTDGIFVRERAVAFVAKDYDGDRVINTDRFILKSISGEREEIKRLRAISGSALSIAEKKLSEIGELHDSLEKIYIDAMDFKELSKLTRRLLISIFKNQTT